MAQISHQDAPVQVVAAVIRRADLYLIAQRPPGKHLAQKWEFPGGKVEPAETLKDALKREIQEELGCQISVGKQLTTVRHSYGAKVIELIPFLASINDILTDPVPREHTAIRWMSLYELKSMDLAEADIPILHELTQLQ